MREGASLWATHPRLLMKTLLLAGVAVLFLATGTAHAKPVIKWQCGRTLVMLHENSFGAPRHWPSGNETERSVYIEFKPVVRGNKILSFEWDPDFERKWIDNPQGDYGTATGGEAWLNGKRCKDYVPDKAKKTGK